MVFNVSIWGAWSFVLGANPRGDGTALMNRSANYLHQN